MATAISEARVATELPRRYMGQLCKHFAHRVPVVLEEDRGEIAFAIGRCEVTAGPAELVLRAEAQDEDHLPTLEDVVARHLLRFTFREPVAINWNRLTA